jgi:hypothetical protein
VQKKWKEGSGDELRQPQKIFIMKLFARVLNWKQIGFMGLVGGQRDGGKGLITRWVVVGGQCCESFGLSGEEEKWQKPFKVSKVILNRTQP